MDALRLDAEAAEWQERARRFVEEELYPAEERIAERGSIDADEVRELRVRARAEGFSHYNLPQDLGCADLPLIAQVAIEEQAGRATNGLGFVVADRGPRELVELATEDQLERRLRPVLRREIVEAWAVTEPGAGSDVGGIAATATRDGADWVLDGEKWFVTGGDHAGFFVVLARAGEGEEQALFLVAATRRGSRSSAGRTSCTTRTSTATSSCDSPLAASPIATGSRAATTERAAGSRSSG